MVKKLPTGILLALLAGGGVAYYLSRRAYGITGVTSTCAVLPDNSCVTQANYPLGSDVKVRTSIPSTYSPVSIQGFYNPGGPGAVHPWDVSLTGYVYTLDFGVFNSPAGPVSIYTVVTTADGKKYVSNTITIVVS